MLLMHHRASSRVQRALERGPPRLRFRKTYAGAAGPGRWVNCGVDPMRASPLWPYAGALKPRSEKLFRVPKSVAQEARNVEIVGGFEGRLTLALGHALPAPRLLGDQRRHVAPAASSPISEARRDYGHRHLVALRVVDHGAEDHVRVLVGG